MGSPSGEVAQPANDAETVALSGLPVPPLKSYVTVAPFVNPHAVRFLATSYVCFDSAVEPLPPFGSYSTV